MKCLSKVQISFFSKTSEGVVLFLVAQLPSNLPWFAHSDSGRADPSAPKMPNQIAAIALAANLKIVTRNTKDFEAIDGLELINPWQLH